MTSDHRTFAFGRALAIAIALPITALGLCMAFWGGLFLLGDLFVPEQTGIFATAGDITSIGILRNPSGSEIYGVFWSPVMALATAIGAFLLVQGSRPLRLAMNDRSGDHAA